MSESRISWWNVLIGFWAVLLLFLLTPLGIPVKMLFERSPEKVAMSGVPIAQAISDYRSDHGLFPLKLADLIPAYLSEIPKGWGWRFEGNDLIKYADQPHSLISFDFTGQCSNQWRFQGDSGLDHRQLNLPGPIVKASVLTGQALITAQVAEYESRIKRNPGDMAF